MTRNSFSALKHQKGGTFVRHLKLPLGLSLSQATATFDYPGHNKACGNKSCKTLDKGSRKWCRGHISLILDGREKSN